MTDTTNVTIEAARRTETGKSYTRKLRKAGKVPAVILEKGKSSLIELDPKYLPKAWKSNDRKFNIVLDGKTSLVKIQELQVDPVKRYCLHVDLMFVEDLPLKLLIGLGNPGQKYERTRHNAGFWVVDRLAEEINASWDDTKLDKFSGLTAKAKVDGVDCVFLKPMTFMNLSGKSVQKFAQFLKISANDWIVFHDDIDLPVHKVRFREGGGGHGGHNGLRSIMEVTGRADFSRIKLGVGRPAKLENGETGMDVADYVLQNMPETEVAAYVSAFMPEVKLRLKDLLKQ